MTTRQRSTRPKVGDVVEYRGSIASRRGRRGRVTRIERFDPERERGPFGVLGGCPHFNPKHETWVYVRLHGEKIDTQTTISQVKVV